MIRALWTAATGMEAQQFDQNIVANNLSNVNTVGFKKSGRTFRISCTKWRRNPARKPPREMS